MSFQIHGLPEANFRDLFSLTEAELDDRSIRRMEVAEHPGYPCRVSLADANVGETVLLLNYEHQPNQTPYRASHAIFVRQGAEQSVPAPGEIPVSIGTRMLSVRAFDRSHDMIDAEVVDGAVLADRIEALFTNPQIDYLHLHYAGRGCFAASVTRR